MFTNWNERIKILDHYNQISHGVDPEFSVPWSKNGYNADIDNQSETLWSAGGVYVWPSSAQAMKVVSTAPTSDKAGGKGALSVYVKYLDSTYTEKSVTKNLTGTAAVSLGVTDIFRIQNFRVASVGSGGAAVGTINLTNSAGTVTYSQIAAGFTRARNSAWTVPAGQTLYVTDITFASGAPVAGNFARFTTKATYDDSRKSRLDAGLFFMPYHEIVCQDGTFHKNLTIPTVLPEKVDIKIDCVGEGNSSNIVATSILRGYVVKNTNKLRK